MRLVMNKYAHGLFDQISLPEGWQITEYVPDTATVSETQQIDALRQKIGTYLPTIVYDLDRFIDFLHRDYDIAVQESYIAVDETATFHITILLSDNDYHSTDLIAAKLHVHEYLDPAAGDVNVKVKFSVAEEYYRSHQTQRVYKLNYLYRNTYAA